MHFTHTYWTYACTYVCICGCNVCICTWMCVTLSLWQRECSGFNKRVGVAQRHPVITVIVDRSGTSLCVAGNHGGQALTSALHTPPVEHPAYFNTRLCSIAHTAISFWSIYRSPFPCLFKCLWWSTCMSSTPAVFVMFLCITVLPSLSQCMLFSPDSHIRKLLKGQGLAIKMVSLDVKDTTWNFLVNKHSCVYSQCFSKKCTVYNHEAEYKWMDEFAS